MQGRSGTSQAEQYLARSDSNLHLLFLLRDILTFLVNCCGITDYWETSTFERVAAIKSFFCFCRTSNFVITAQLSNAGPVFALLKGFRALHSIIWTKPHKKSTCSIACLEVCYVFSWFAEGRKKCDRSLSRHWAFSTERLKNLQMLRCSPHFV